MRTTLTIDDQLAAELKKRAFESGRSFKEVVNESLRRGLAPGQHTPPAPPYRLKSVSLGGALPGVNLDKALQLAELLEDEAVRDKMELRK